MHELNTTQWMERLLSLSRPGTENVLLYYEHRMGGFCRDPHLMLVPLDDHLVHRGDGVFEALRMTEGHIVQLDAHMRRLEDSATALSLTPPCSWNEVRSLLLEAAKAADTPEGSLKLLLGRGGGGLGVDPRQSAQSSLYIVVTQGTRLPERFWTTGLTAARSAIPPKQEYLARIKSTNYLPNVLMSMEAASQGVDLTFSFDANGFLTESAVANVAVVEKNGTLLFPEFRQVLPGTTACLAKEVAKSFMPVLTTDIPESLLMEAAEILVLGTTPECVAVVAYEGKPVGTGKPGSVAHRLRAELHKALLASGVQYR